MAPTMAIMSWQVTAALRVTFHFKDYLGPHFECLFPLSGLWILKSRITNLLFAIPISTFIGDLSRTSLNLPCQEANLEDICAEQKEELKNVILRILKENGHIDLDHVDDDEY